MPTLLSFWDFTSHQVHLYSTHVLQQFPERYHQATTQIYNHPNYLKIQAPETIYTLTITNHLSQRTQWMHFLKYNNSLVNGFKAPWGGWEGTTMHGFIPANEWKLILNTICQLVGVETIETTFPPLLYKPSFCMIPKDIGELQPILTTCLIISDEPYVKRIRSNEIRRGKKGRKADIQTAFVPIDDSLFAFIKQCYQERNYTLSISYSVLSLLMNKFPNSYFALGAFCHGQLIAATICVYVNEHLIYNYLPVTKIEWKSYSPMVLLYEHLYSYCQANDINYLELGTSMDGSGLSNPSLQKFKINMGGVLLAKYRFTYRYQGRTSS